MKNSRLGRLFSAVLLTILFAASSPVAAGPLSGSYPVVLAHGILGFDDTNGLANGLIKYWGGLDGYLRGQGVPVLTPGVTALNGPNYRGPQLKSAILYWMAANNYSKVHIIAHSQGGLDSRYMVANLGMSGKVRSITTVNSVHRGTPVADVALAVIPSWLQPTVGTLLNLLGQAIYGSKQDVIAMAKSLTTGYLSTFNNTSPNHSAVKYFSYASAMTIADLVQHPLMGLTYPITWTGGVFNGQGGKNDGVVPYSSQKWGTFKGDPATPWYATGVDHLQATNFAKTGQLWYDVHGYYLTMATNAKNNQ